MKSNYRFVRAAALGLACLLGATATAQTDGVAKMEVTLHDYSGGDALEHWTVAWVTTGAGAFIKTLRKQGPTITSTHWNSHCRQWYTARGTNTILDGYSSATATTFSGTNSPVILTWNGRDANNTLMPDGTYVFWVQYAKDAGQGPYTTNGLVWTKGPAGATNTYPNIAGNFSNMKVTWTPAGAPKVPPTITSPTLPSTGTVGVAYAATAAATGTAPITFSAQGLPPGVTISSAGAVSGTPTQAGSFSGSITAANGTLPNGTQTFSINVGTVPVQIELSSGGNGLVMTGTGPANGKYRVLESTNMVNWTVTATNSIDGTGKFTYSPLVEPGRPLKFYRLQIP